MKIRAIMALGVGLALTLLLSSVACRDIQEEEPVQYTFIQDTPPDGASDVNPLVLLHCSIWSEMQLVDEVDLFFGTTPYPPFLKKLTRRDAGYLRPGPLKQNQIYYWRLSVPAPPGSSKVQSFTVGRDRTVWTFQLAPGQSIYDVPGAPIVQGRCVFQKNEGGIFHCLDAVTGSPLWTFTPSQAGSAPAVPQPGSEKIFIASGKIYCLDAATGILLWSAAPANSHLGFHQPEIQGARVFTYTNERISCLDAETGTEVWGVDSDCKALRSENDRVFAISGTSTLKCFDAETGAVLWSKNFDSQLSDIAPGPQRLFVGSGKKLHCLDAGNGTGIWEYEAAEYAANPFVINGNVFLATGQDRYALLNAIDGSELWNRMLEKTDYQHYTSSNGDPVLVGSTIMLADWSGYIYAIDAATGEIRWHYFVSTDMTGIASFGNRVYVTGDDECVYCLDTE